MIVLLIGRAAKGEAKIGDQRRVVSKAVSIEEQWGVEEGALAKELSSEAKGSESILHSQHSLYNSFDLCPLGVNVFVYSALWEKSNFALLEKAES